MKQGEICFALFGYETMDNFTTTHYALEQLHFTVIPENVERFLSLDTEIWTKNLSKYDGFIKKEVWVNDTGDVYTFTYWRDLACWKALDSDELSRLQAAFDEAMGKDNYIFNTPPHLNNQRYVVRIFTK